MFMREANSRQIIVVQYVVTGLKILNRFMSHKIERGVKFQFIDLKEKELSKGEFRSVQQVLETPIVRNGKQATVGYQLEV